MSNFAIRVISGILLGAAALVALTLHPLSRWLFISAILCLGAWEFSRMIFQKYPGRLPPAFDWSAAVFAGAFSLVWLPGLSSQIGHLHSIWPWLVMCLAILFYTGAGFLFIPIGNMILWILLNLAGILLFGVWSLKVFELTSSASGIKGIASLLLVIICIICADTGAYLIGKAYGTHKLCPDISPKKTLEGLAGGLLATVMAASFLGPWLTGMGSAASAGFGLFIAVTAVMGDLFFSGLKRHSGIKDSSNLIPGHGGVLDRFDAVFFSAPMAVLYFELISR
jgi:phosphatidate cytidylyltransferase